MSARQEQTLEPKLNLVKFPMNARQTYRLGKDVPWVAELLKELNAPATDKTPEEWLAETSLDIELELTKRFKGEMGEFLLAKGKITAVHATECVLTLRPMKERFESEFKACFLEQSVLATEEYDKVDEVWQDGDTYDVYSYDRRQPIDLAEMLHEQAFLQVNPYPRCETAPGLDGGLETDKTRQ